jgi:hypothetical protein
MGPRSTMLQTSSKSQSGRTVNESKLCCETPVYDTVSRRPFVSCLCLLHISYRTNITQALTPFIIVTHKAMFVDYVKVSFLALDYRGSLYICVRWRLMEICKLQRAFPETVSHHKGSSVSYEIQRIPSICESALTRQAILATFWPSTEGVDTP